MSSEMTVDECFDILDTLLGTDGYIAITEAVKKLKEDKDKYFGYLKDKDLECEEQRKHAQCLAQKVCNERDNTRGYKKGYQRINKQVEELKVEVKALKEEIYGDDVWGIKIGLLKEKQNLITRYKCTVRDIIKLKAENKALNKTILERDEELGDINENVFTGYDNDIAKLKEQVSNYHEAQSYLMPACSVPNDLGFEAKLIELKAENRDLKAENKELKSDDIYQHKIIQKYNEENTMFHCQVNRLEEEIKQLKEGL